MEPIKYMSALLTFYLKGEITADRNFVTFKMPNTILGLIPLGAKKENVAINQIASTTTNFKLRFVRLLLGILITGAAFYLFTESFILGLILLLIGVGTALDAFEVNLQVVMTSGQVKLIDFFIFEKSKAALAEKQINAMISNRLDDTNNRQQTDRIVEAINNK